MQAGRELQDRHVRWAQIQASLLERIEDARRRIAPARVPAPAPVPTPAPVPSAWPPQPPQPPASPYQLQQLPTVRPSPPSSAVADAAVRAWAAAQRESTEVTKLAHARAQAISQALTNLRPSTATAPPTPTYLPLGKHRTARQVKAAANSEAANRRAARRAHLQTNQALHTVRPQPEEGDTPPGSAYDEATSLRPLFGVAACRNWSSVGACVHGASCHFRHAPPPETKTAKQAKKATKAKTVKISQPKLPQDLLHGVLTVQHRPSATYTDLLVAENRQSEQQDRHQYELNVTGAGTWRNTMPHASRGGAKSELACLALKALGYRAVPLPPPPDGSPASYKLAVLSAAARPPPLQPLAMRHPPQPFSTAPKAAPRTVPPRPSHAVARLAAGNCTTDTPAQTRIRFRTAKAARAQAMPKLPQARCRASAPYRTVLYEVMS